MTNAAFIFALCLGATVLAAMLVASHATVRDLERKRRAAAETLAKNVTPEEVHAAGVAPFKEATDLRVSSQVSTVAQRISEHV